MQQPSSREMEAGGGGSGDGGGMSSMLSHEDSQVSLDHLHHPQNGQFHESQNSHHQQQQQQDDFLEQMLSTINPNCSWPSTHTHDLPPSNPNPNNPTIKSGDSPPEDPSDPDAFHYPFDDSSKLRHPLQINGTAKSFLHQQLLLSRGAAALRSPSAVDSGLVPLPLSLATADSVLADRSLPDVVDPSPFKSPAAQQGAGDAPVSALYSGFGGSLHGNTHATNQQQHLHHHPQIMGGGGAIAGQNYGAQAAVMNQAQAPAPPTSASTGGSSGAAPQRQRVRARRGQATDPHSIAERLRRERIAERMKALQELVPNANKTDKASMLDEIIDYVKFLQLQVKVLSMSRLGGAGAVAPLVADMSSEGGGGVVGRSSNGNQTPTNDSMTVTEHQVAKLMEEDMGSAMQYLQGKGLCLMPISLATAISTATCHSRSLPSSRPPLNGGAGNDLNAGSTNSNNHSHLVAVQSNGEGGPSSPSISVLTVQSATLANASNDPSIKDTNPSKS